MENTKFKERVETAQNAFFDDDFFGASDFLRCRSQNEFLESEESKEIVVEISTLETVLKQVFLFFPGTFLLYILSLGFTVMFANLFMKPLEMTLQYELFWLIVLFFAAILMTWLGLGDVRKSKHFIIPASIIGVGIFFGTIAGVLINISNSLQKIILTNDYPLYFFPLALIVPFLAKGWIDGKTEN